MRRVTEEIKVSGRSESLCFFPGAPFQSITNHFDQLQVDEFKVSLSLLFYSVTYDRLYYPSVANEFIK